MCCGSVVSALFIINPANIVRDDGTKIAMFTNRETTTFAQEMKGILDMGKDWRLMLLGPSPPWPSYCMLIIVSAGNVCNRTPHWDATLSERQVRDIGSVSPSDTP